MQKIARRLRPLLALTVVLAACGPGPASAADAAKWALVIGNSRYGGGRELLNTGNDARLMAGTLARLGFTVTEQHDLNRAQFETAVGAFAARLPAGATAFVYYAGHGMQLEGNNYLTPVDMPVTSMSAAKLHSYALNTLLDALGKSKSAINVVVLDACRNNPFQPGAAVRYRSFENLGLSARKAPHGTLIAYSTLPGQQAPDGTGSNSIYTQTLARMLAQPGTELDVVFKQVGNEVRRQTRDDQIPWYETSLAGAYYLTAPDPAGRGGAPAPAQGRVAASTRGQALRGVAARQEVVAPWYRQLNAAESSQVDWEIQQRVKRLTPDEIPALAHQASGGNVVAQTVLGLAYREGIEAARVAGTQTVARYKANNGMAWKWLRKAAEAGFPMAQAEIGEMYFQAHGTDPDPDKSRYWIGQAARTDYPRAKLDLVQLQGVGSPNDAGVQDAVRSMVDSFRLPVNPAGPAQRANPPAAPATGRH